MSNIPFEPKDGDYASLIERLGKTSIDEIKDEINKTQKEHQRHAGKLQSESIEKNFQTQNQQKSPINSTSSSNRISEIQKNSTDSKNKFTGLIIFIGFLIFAVVTGVMSQITAPEDEELIIFPIFGFIIFVAIFSQGFKNKKSNKEK